MLSEKLSNQFKVLILIVDAQRESSNAMRVDEIENGESVEWARSNVDRVVAFYYDRKSLPKTIDD